MSDECGACGEFVLECMCPGGPRVIQAIAETSETVLNFLKDLDLERKVIIGSVLDCFMEVTESLSYPYKTFVRQGAAMVLLESIGQRLKVEKSDDENGL